MPCYYPMKAWRSRLGKTKNGKWPITFDKKEGYIDKELTIPCGHCIGCRLERSRQWAIRCVHEASLHHDNCFITLTYNKDNVDKNRSLDKRDFMLFMKRLRKQCGKGIRFFHCGEYGECCGVCGLSRKECICEKYTPDIGRPHHHACIFNYKFRDRLLWDVRNGISLYRSPSLEKLWTYGYSVIGDVTWESAAYVARYVTKKITGEKAENHYKGRLPEYVTMSRNPGIAYEWYVKNKYDLYRHDMLVIRDGFICKPVRYYDKIFEMHEPHLMARKKYRREKNAKLNVNNTPEQLKLREYLHKKKIRNLYRPYERGAFDA